MLEDPSAAACLPRGPPDHRMGAHERRCYTGLVGVVGCATEGTEGHPIDELAAFVFVEAVGIRKQPDLFGATLRTQEALNRVHVRTVELAVEPNRLSARAAT